MNSIEQIKNINPKEGIYYFNILKEVKYNDSSKPLITKNFLICSNDYGRGFDISVYQLFNNMLINGPHYLIINKLLPDYINWKKLRCCMDKDPTCVGNNINKIKNIDFLWISSMKIPFLKKNIEILFRGDALIKKTNYNLLINKNLFYNILKMNNGEQFIPKYWIIVLNKNDYTDIDDFNLDNFHDLCNKYANIFINIIRKITINDEKDIINKMLLLKYAKGSLGDMIFGLIIKENTDKAYNDTIEKLTKELIGYFEENINDITKISLFGEWQLSYYIKSVSFNSLICNEAKINILNNNILDIIKYIPALKIRYYITIFYSDDLSFSIILHKIMDTDIITQYINNDEDIYDRYKFISNINSLYEIYSKLFNENYDILINNYKNYQLFLYNCLNIYCNTYSCNNESGVDKIHNQEKKITEILYNTLFELYNTKCFSTTNIIKSCFEIFAIDIIIDTNLNIKILEINSLPVIQNGYAYYLGNDIYPLIFEKVIAGNHEYNEINNDLGFIEHNDFIMVGKKKSLLDIIKTTTIKKNNFDYLIHASEYVDIISKNINDSEKQINNIVSNLIEIYRRGFNNKQITDELKNNYNKIISIIENFKLTSSINYFNRLYNIYQKYDIFIGHKYYLFAQMIINNLSTFNEECIQLIKIISQIIKLVDFDYENISLIAILTKQSNLNKINVETYNIPIFLSNLYDEIIILINNLKIKIIRFYFENDKIKSKVINSFDKNETYIFPSIYISIINFLNKIKDIYINDYNRYYKIYKSLETNYNLQNKYTGKLISDYKNFYKKYIKYKLKYINFKQNL